MGSRYVPISREQFTAQMDKAGFCSVAVPDCLEMVFERQIVWHTTPLPYAVRVYSTIDVRTDDSRDCGADAIRVVLIERSTTVLGKVIAAQRKVLRTKSALENTLERARELWRYALNRDHYCGRCQALLVERESKHGKFFGCSHYPECKFTKPRTD